MNKIEVYWADTEDGERHSVEYPADDERAAQAFATWLGSTDGIAPESVRVALPEQRTPKRETVEEALESDRCGECGSVEHFREDCPTTQLDPASEAYRAMIAAHDAVCSDRGCDPMTMGMFRDGLKPLTPEGEEIARGIHNDALNRMRQDVTAQPWERYRELVGKRVRVTLDHNRHDPLATMEGILVGVDQGGGVSVFAADGLHNGWPCLEVEAL